MLSIIIIELIKPSAPLKGGLRAFPCLNINLRLLCPAALE